MRLSRQGAGNRNTDNTWRHLLPPPHGGQAVLISLHGWLQPVISYPVAVSIGDYAAAGQSHPTRMTRCQTGWTGR